jgi:hypothetical protein
LGTRLLSGLPEQASRLHRRFYQQPA